INHAYNQWISEAIKEYMLLGKIKHLLYSLINSSEDGSIFDFEEALSKKREIGIEERIDEVDVIKKADDNNIDATKADINIDANETDTLYTFIDILLLFSSSSK
ncbi:7642_t:CDS:2, partial [Cetraspora pellucida]